MKTEKPTPCCCPHCGHCTKNETVHVEYVRVPYRVPSPPAIPYYPFTNPIYGQFSQASSSANQAPLGFTQTIDAELRQAQQLQGQTSLGAVGLTSLCAGPVKTDRIR